MKLLNRKHPMKSILQIFVVLLCFTALLHAQTIPQSVRTILNTNTNEPPQLMATAQDQNSTYYLALEPDPIESKQALVVVDKNKPPRLLARANFIFPLDQYKLRPTATREICRQYVQYRRRRSSTAGES